MTEPNKSADTTSPTSPSSPDELIKDLDVRVSEAENVVGGLKIKLTDILVSSYKPNSSGTD